MNSPFHFQTKRLTRSLIFLRRNACYSGFFDEQRRRTFRVNLLARCLTNRHKADSHSDPSSPEFLMKSPHETATSDANFLPYSCGSSPRFLIRRYCRAGMPQCALRTYKFACGLDATLGSNDEPNLFEILFDSLCKEGHCRFAWDLLSKKREQDPSWSPSIRLYNVLFKALFQSRKIDNVDRLLLEIRDGNITPNVFTFATLIKGFCRMRRVSRAIQLVEEMRNGGIKPNAILYNPVIDALAQTGNFIKALGMMERLSLSDSGPTISTYNSLLKGFCKAGDLAGASRILKMMMSNGLVPTCTTYNYFFQYFSKSSMIEEAMNLYRKLAKNGYTFDRITYLILMKLLCARDELNLAVVICNDMRMRGCDLDLATSTMLINLLCRLRKFKEAFAVLKSVICRGIIPHYVTFQKMSDELKKLRMNGMARRLHNMMDSLRRSGMFVNTNGLDEDSAQRRRSVILKAKAMSAVLNTCTDPRNLIKQRGSVNHVPAANDY